MENVNNNSEQYLSVTSASKFFGISPTLLYHWLRNRKLEHVRVGKKILIRQSELNGFLEANTVEIEE